MSKLYNLLSAMCGKIKKPDWDQNDPTAADYVKNRPFYTKPGVEILPEITFNGSLTIDGSIGLEIGTQYTVMVNGIACPCVTRSMDLIVKDPVTGTEERYKIPELAFGNPVGNGYIYISDNYVDDYINFDTAGDYTEALIISIVSEDEVVKIPEKYLPDGYGSSPPDLLIENGMIFPEISFAEKEGDGHTFDASFGEVIFNLNSPIVAGETYIVTFDGVPYNVVANVIGEGVAYLESDNFIIRYSESEYSEYGDYNAGLNVFNSETDEDGNYIFQPFTLKITTADSELKLNEQYFPTTIVTDEKLEKRLEGITNTGGNVDYVGVEPAEDDIPKVFFGGALQQTKTEAVVPFRYISKTDDFIGYAEIKAQGNSSMSYPKKNQTVKMFKDADCAEKMKVDFKGWGKQNKHVYKANWIDLSHARNVVSARLWGDVVKSRANYAELPELLKTSPNQGAIDGFPVKVYAAGVYQGRYTLNIPKDAWMANMDDELDNHCILCGEGYNSGCFRSVSTAEWTDEIHDSMPTTISNRWKEVITFVMNSTDEDFRANLGNYFDISSLIDYHLYGLLSCGLDAYGKNQLYLTYDGQKWLASMYDMDSTWGLYWNGSKFVATDYARTSYEDFVSGRQGNLLYIRLEQLFWSELQTRWAELRNGALSIENIINRFERFTDIAPAELVKEDYASTTGGGKFTGIPSQTTNNIQQIRAFALERQAWTDEYVAGLTPEVEVPCTGISLDAETLTFTAEGSQTLTATVTPDGCTDPVTWESDNSSVATVSGGVVTAIANGSAIITAKCGEYSASCAVAVSGIAEAVPCTGITLDKTELTFDGEGTQTVTATVTPSDTTDPVVWVSSAPAVASITVEGNACTVQSVANGNAVITVTCGDYTATCSVAVSGCANTVLNWTATPNYKLNPSGELIAGDGYVSDMFALEKGNSYFFFNNIAGASTYAQIALYNDDGTLARYSEFEGNRGINILDTSTIGKARLTVYPISAGSVDLSSVNLVKNGTWSTPGCRLNTTGVANADAIILSEPTENLTDYITLTGFPVEPGKTYRLSGKDGDTSTWKRISAFDSDNKLISNMIGSATTDAVELTAPENAAYVRYSVYCTSSVLDLLEFAEVTD